MNIGYWVELRGYPLAEGSTAQWMQAFPFGVYKHPMYGQINMTPDRARRMADNVNNRVREIDIALDYDHSDNGGPAPGWVQKAEVRDDGLWLQVEWTPEGAEKLRMGSYRYFSPEIAKTWTHPKTGVTYQDVLMGGALTNRPFLKDILPVNLSEIMGGECTVDDNGRFSFSDTVETGGSMDVLKKLAETLGIKLSEEATAEQIVEAITQTFTDKMKTPVEEKPPVDEAITKLAEDNPVIASLVERLNAQDKHITTLVAAGRLSEVRTKLAEWRMAGSDRKWGLPMGLDEHFQKLMLGASPAQMEALTIIMSEMLKTGLVRLGETKMRTPSSGGSNGDIFKEVQDKVDALRKGNDKMTEVDALAQIFDEDTALYERYRDASYALTASAGEEG